MYGYHGYQQQMPQPTHSVVDGKMHNLNTYLNYIRAYRDPLRVAKDLKETFHLFPNLSPYYENIPSRNINLINIKGTIPICFKNINYYLPIIVWVPLNYPLEYPTIFLDPTPEMRIVESHQHANLQGLVYHPYISSWNSASTLGQCLKLLCDAFSFKPPLETKSPNSSPSTTSSQYNQPPPPYGSSPSGSPVNSNGNNNTGSIPPPPYGSSPGASSNYVPPPSYDSSIQKKNAALAAAASKGLGDPSIAIPPPIPQKPQPPPTKSLPQIPPQPVIDKKKELIDECTIKLQEILSQYYDTTVKEIKDFQVHNRSLEELSKKQQLEKGELQEQLALYNSQIDQLNENITQLEKWIKENDKPETDIDIDAMLGPKDPLSKQLLKLVSDDSTIEDLLYYLDKALHSNRISLDEYLKNVRSLSRDQFMIKATVKKVQYFIRQNQQQFLQQQQQQQQSSPQSNNNQQVPKSLPQFQSPPPQPPPSSSPQNGHYQSQLSQLYYKQ
ncbi:hypothetical protein DICPUDRAFT_155276 [Dictyostelium purpureum]|uniref:UEV domain-containing protein n=1 Tax=Dictyostelium purpureum TaxID=5786 RepID=F0ZTJ6_DICPU|nr:uncharacterized protein DICPUDRAFT_155276 [Dictyostelium purpureum]EGC32743.1 hypothetical protein DICPUDRAFT_155276 [Dictyostelium purpureum]|eukprot:XP_003290741.1 hypothetical protein DICPUDRAFT_155276 [Dictyostelium purpureum]